MTFKTDNAAIVTPGYAGFIPSMKYEIGETYGNATRRIFEVHPTLKQKVERINQVQPIHEPRHFDHHAVTTDERFSFPLVPGYTGYVPRIQEHLGRGYVNTTTEAFQNFTDMNERLNQPPPKIRELLQRQQQRRQREEKPSNEGVRNQPDAKHSFISGYTGYVPKLKNHFGKSIQKTIEDGDIAADHLKVNNRVEHYLAADSSVEHPLTKPVPGFTGHIPGSKHSFATPYGKLNFSMPGEKHKEEDDKYYVEKLDITGTFSKNWAKRNPIPGYMGFVPGYAFTAEKPYGQSSRACFEKFVQESKQQ